MKVFYCPSLWAFSYGSYHAVVVAESALHAADLVNAYTKDRTYLARVCAEDMIEVTPDVARIVAVDGYGE